jgi:xylulokinase
MDSGSRGAILGLTLETGAYDLYKALMEGVGYEMLLNIEHFEKAGIHIGTLRATGGGASSEKWLQIKADILGRPVTALDSREAGTVGTIMLAGVAIGAFQNLEDAAAKFVKEQKTYGPGENYEDYGTNYQRYRRLYDAVRPLV